jgi:hypothetical protein
MWLAYLDESKQDNSYFVYTALITGDNVWKEAFNSVKMLRNSLKANYGIYTNKELHAWKFAAGKGRISHRPISKETRAAIFRDILLFVSCNRHRFRVFSSVNRDEFIAFDRLINRINRTATRFKTNAILICDEGQQFEFTKRIRKMRVHNHISSSYGVWEDGKSTKNITIDQFIEDPFFKDSRSSYFIQLVDFCAYALLRMELTDTNPSVAFSRRVDKAIFWHPSGHH